MISQEALRELEKAGKKNQLLADCHEELMKFIDSPYLESYNTTFDLIVFFNKQIKDAVEGNLVIQVGEEGVMETEKVELNIFANKDDKGFDRVLKYVTELSKILLA